MADLSHWIWTSTYQSKRLQAITRSTRSRRFSCCDVSSLTLLICAFVPRSSPSCAAHHTMASASNSRTTLEVECTTGPKERQPTLHQARRSSLLPHSAPASRSAVMRIASGMVTRNTVPRSKRIRASRYSVRLHAKYDEHHHDYHRLPPRQRVKSAAKRSCSLSLSTKLTPNRIDGTDNQRPHSPSGGSGIGRVSCEYVLHVHAGSVSS